MVLSVAAAPPAGATYPWDLDTGREAALLGVGAGFYLAGRLAADTAAPTAADQRDLDPAGLPVWDRSATRRWSPAASRASDILVGTLVAAPVGLMVTPPGAERGGRLALIYTETFLLTSGATYALKNLVNRPRPYAYNPDPRIPPELRRAPRAGRSFPSGHTAQAFAAMVFFAESFARLNPDSGARGWVWGGCLTAATATGVLRYVAGRHFPTDILAGAALGTAAGWLVPRLHEVEGQAAPPGGGAARFALGFAF